MTDGGRPSSSHDPGAPPGATPDADATPGSGDAAEREEDDRLLALLGRALAQSDPIPAHVADAAKSALTWRTIDAELAELVFDSTLEAAGVRAEEMDRQLTFRAPGVEIEAMFLGETTRRLVGQLVPPSELTVELVGSEHVTTITSDRLGRFTFEEVELGPVRLVVRDAEGGPVVQTEWVIF